MSHSESGSGEFKPYIASEQTIPEFTVKALVMGALFGVLFGAATVYLALKAGLTVSASIPIAVIAISLGRKLLRTNILENNIIQTAGSAGESIAAGVVFTLPGFLFLSAGPGGASVGAPYFNYLTLFLLSLVGGILGVLMMIPLRRSLIVKEHGQLQYPEGAACASVLIAGDKGGDFARTAFQGVGLALAYAILQKVFHVIAETPAWVTRQTNKWLPSATVNGEITPEYLGVGYIIGPKIAGVLVAGGVLAWLGLIPLLAVLVPPDTIAEQLVKLGMMKSLATAGGPGGCTAPTCARSAPGRWRRAGSSPC
jgi:putative OPT family oligopeptide transporter